MRFSFGLAYFPFAEVKTELLYDGVTFSVGDFDFSPFSECEKDRVGG